ncbi:hypothetical protein KSF_098900 [Reticulibacter mediterranei]|uniref:Uncharacterized protein n=1 Tax=Reticulibacter mediterranei TaxID=2778369 RepID=A0A8J3N9Z2_9CHLR|nr:hypothetical protein [Reticulibacter mediterranei]GHO99842.1 hypothetical protein KSF_098900 [Reticulibacter mediterranei]
MAKQKNQVRKNRMQGPAWLSRASVYTPIPGHPDRRGRAPLYEEQTAGSKKEAEEKAKRALRYRVTQAVGAAAWNQVEKEVTFKTRRLS